MSQERISFIKKHSDNVIDSVSGTGIFPSVKMAQMIIESADSNGVPGNGIVFRKANNAFGIKANSSWTGQKMSFSTPNDGTPISYFRVYPAVKDSLNDHTKFLIQNSRYKSAGVFTAKTPEEQAQALQRAGYAESGTYANAIISIINAYQLKELDKKAQKKK